MENLVKIILMYSLLTSTNELNSISRNKLNNSYQHNSLNFLADTTNFSSFINDFVTNIRKKDSTLIKKHILKKVCVSHPHVLINQSDSSINISSGFKQKCEVVKLLILGLNTERIERLKNRSNWILVGNQIEIYDSFYCKNCPDDNYSYYWCFKKIKNQFFLVKIFNNDNNLSCD